MEQEPRQGGVGRACAGQAERTCSGGDGKAGRGPEQSLVSETGLVGTTEGARRAGGGRAQWGGGPKIDFVTGYL